MDRKAFALALIGAATALGACASSSDDTHASPSAEQDLSTASIGNGGGCVTTSQGRSGELPWLRANARMSELVRDDIAPSIDRIAELNALVHGAEQPVMRATPIHIGPYECPRPEDISFLLAPLLSEVIERTERVHPIAGAALFEQWLATVHPFPDGNGRTARLVADWHLAVHGYPPASYPSVRASFKAVVDHGGEPATPVDAATGLLAGLHHTLRIVTRAPG